MGYTPNEEKELKKVIAVFNCYIQNNAQVDLTQSQKFGYFLLKTDSKFDVWDGMKVNPIFIENATMLCHVLLLEIASDVTSACEKCKLINNADTNVSIEIEKGLQPFVQQLPEYAALAQQIIHPPTFML